MSEAASQHNVSKSANERKEDLLTLYKTAHDWARHHQTVAAQMNALGLSFNGAIITFILAQMVKPETRNALFLYLFAVPIVISSIFLIVTRLIDASIREAFTRMVVIETNLGFFDLKSADGTQQVLPSHLKASGAKRWPHIHVWNVTNLLVIGSCIALAMYFRAALQ